MNISAKFEKITRYNITNFFQEYADFLENDLRGIIEYFSGNSDKLDKGSYKKLGLLKNEVGKILGIFQNNKNKFQSSDFWGLLEQVENIQINLKTIGVLDKYTKTTRKNGSFSDTTSFEYHKKSGESLESVSLNRLSKNNYQDDWVNTAVENNLYEDSYELEAVKKLKLKNKSQLQQNKIEVVYDNLEGERVYGIDMKKSVGLVDDDLEVLGYKETAEQSAEILNEINKGDIPEFQNLGKDQTFFVGSNISTISFPALIRQQKAVFETDDTFSDFSIKDIRREGEYIIFEYQVTTKHRLILEKTIKL